MFVDLFKLSDLSRAQNLINCIRLRLTRTEKLCDRGFVQICRKLGSCFPCKMSGWVNPFRLIRL